VGANIEPDADLSEKGGGEIAPLRRARPLCGSEGATSLRVLRIDLARHLSDLEMTWRLYFAGAATGKNLA